MIKNSKGTLVVGIAVYAACVAFGLNQSSADARYRRVPAANCQGYGNNHTNAQVESSLRATRNIAIGVVCGVPSDSELAHGAVRTLNVHGLEASGKSNYSRACTKTYNSTSFKCGTSRYWGSGSAGASHVSLSEWSSAPYNFPYVYTYLAAGGQVYGVYMAN